MVISHRRFKKRERLAFCELIDIYKQKVFEIGLMMSGNIDDAEEIAMKTFLQEWNNFKRYDDFEKISFTLYYTALGQSIAHLKQKHEVPPSIQLKEKQFSNKNVDQKHVLNPIQNALMALSESDRSVITLRHTVNLSIEEISNVLKTPVAKVKISLYRSREFLCKYM